MTRIELDGATAYLETRDGRRVIVIKELGGTEVELALPARDPWRPVWRLGLVWDRLVAEVRGDSMHDAFRGGFVIAAPEFADGRGGVNGAG
jgi:hypothetical protein